MRQKPSSVLPSPAMAVAVATLLAASSALPMAAMAANPVIHACASKKTGALRLARKCRRNERSVRWSQVGPQGPRGLGGANGAPGAHGAPGQQGPQGPGATKLVYDATAVGSISPTMLGPMGPWTLSAYCHLSQGITEVNLIFTGPAGREDGFYIFAKDAQPISELLPASTPIKLLGITATYVPLSISSMQALMVPASGTSIEVSVTVEATGLTTHTCHASVVLTPVS